MRRGGKQDQAAGKDPWDDEDDMPTEWPGSSPYKHGKDLLVRIAYQYHPISDDKKELLLSQYRNSLAVPSKGDVYQMRHKQRGSS